MVRLSAFMCATGCLAPQAPSLPRGGRWAVGMCQAPGTPADAVSRADFLETSSVAAALVSAGLGGGWTFDAPPALADSTGKFSSKATARKRYLPRISKGVAGFQALKGEISSGT
ncbi:unnamed protein product [Discosporangium mesarthrocarpum]